MSNSSKYKIKHHKDLHKVQLQGLKVKERSIFMALCYKSMEQDNNLLEFDVDDIAKISGYIQQTGENIYKYLRQTYKSLKDITIEIDKTNGYKEFVLFTSFETFEDTRKVQFKVNEDYRYLLNQVVSPFTIQNMLEYRQLDSRYSQLMYSILKQWEGQKYISITIEDFRQKLDIPKSFKISHIDTRVLTPIKKELSKYFTDLKIEKIKTGRKITSIIFSWTEKEKKIKEKLPLIVEIQKETVKTPIINEVRQCIANYPNSCHGHSDKKISDLCKNMRKYIGNR